MTRISPASQKPERAYDVLSEDEAVKFLKAHVGREWR